MRFPMSLRWSIDHRTLP